MMASGDYARQIARQLRRQWWRVEQARPGYGDAWYRAKVAWELISGMPYDKARHG